MSLLAADDAIQIIDEWLSRGRSYYWSKTPSEVKAQLALSEKDGWIDYHLAVRILKSAETSKMHGYANRGVEYIRSEWSKIKQHTKV